jgi:hypothetical protein
MVMSLAELVQSVLIMSVWRIRGTNDTFKKRQTQIILFLILLKGEEK